MAFRTLYQTLKNRDNDEEVLTNGPFICNDSKAWLCEGYYFWEEFVEPALHWGNTYNKGCFIITKGKCCLPQEDLFDLAGNLDHVRQLEQATELIRNSGLNINKLTVPHVIDFLRRTQCFPFTASRADTTGAFKKDFADSIKFDHRRGNYTFTLTPAFQICVYNLESIMFSNYCIVHKSS